MHLFTTLGINKLLWSWLPFGGYLLYIGKLSRKDAEVVILRVGHLRDCEYELQQHRRLARTRGIGPDLQAKIFEGPDTDGLTDRQRALITATDEFVVTRGVSPETWTTLSSHLSRAQLVEFCMLAATIRRARQPHHAESAGLPEETPRHATTRTSHEGLRSPPADESLPKGT